MQSAFHCPPHDSFLQLPHHYHLRRPQFLRHPIAIITSKRQKPDSLGHPKTHKGVSFLESSSQLGLEEEVIDEQWLPASSPLPSSNGPLVVVRKSGRACRYVWDGTRLLLVPCESEAAKSNGVRHGFSELFRVAGDALRRLFVPHKVQPHYLKYLKWKLLHRIFSSALQVLATQALFRAIGFGSSRALSSAAALNWMLKDGLGRFSRCIYTASLGAAFDTNLKRVRFSTSVLFSLSIGIELLTPTFPQHFLLLATMANIAKSISLAAYIATGSAIHRSFAVADNLGEVSAKAQIQTVCFDMIGLLFAATMNEIGKTNQRFQAGLPLFVYPLFSAVDLFAIYQGLKHVHLQTLTKDRLEIVIERWIHTGLVPSPADVSNIEGIFPERIGNKSWPIRIGAIDPKGLSPKISMMSLKMLKKEAYYFICMETFPGLMTIKWKHGILLSLREGVGTTDIITGMLQACRVRKLLLTRRGRWEHNTEPSSICGPAIRDWFSFVEDSRKYALHEVDQLAEEIQIAGWAVKNILLSTPEQIRYNLVGE